MSDNDWKVLLALIGALVGWTLAQAATIARFLWRRRWLKKHLLLELDDLHEDLKQTLLHYEGQIRIAAIEHIHPAARVAIEAPIYSVFFTEAYAGLNRAQRTSYKMLHAQVRAVNEGFEHAADMLRGLDPRGISREELKKRGEDWMEFLKGQYMNTAKAFAHVHFHRENPDRPDLGGPYGEIAQWFGKQDHIAADHIIRFVEESKGKTLAELKVHMADRQI